MVIRSGEYVGAEMQANDPPVQYNGKSTTSLAKNEHNAHFLSSYHDFMT